MKEVVLMPDEQPSRTPRSGPTEWIVLELLLDPEAQRPWSLEEVAREIGTPIAVADALDGLHAAGLVHRTADGFVFATRAVVRYHELAEVASHE
jgi:predicted transcriptional regulator